MQRLEPPTNRFSRHPLRTAAVLLVLALVGSEVTLRLLAPDPVAFAHDARQIYRYHDQWYTDFIPNTTTWFRLSDGNGHWLLNFLVTINQHGFRWHDRVLDHPLPIRQGSADLGQGRSSEPQPADSTTKLVHAVGDSFTMGWGVGFESSYPAILDERLGPNIQVLNLGLNGFGIIGATGKSAALAQAFPPDAVVYLATENDYADDAKAIRYAGRSGLTHRAMGAVNWIRRHSYLGSLPFALRQWLRLDRVEPSEVQTRGGNATEARTRPAIETLTVEPMSSNPSLGRPSKQALTKTAKQLREQRIPLLVVLHGSGPVVRDLAAFCTEQDIEHRSIVFPQQMILRGEGHLNRLGNQALAEFIEPWVRGISDS